MSATEQSLVCYIIFTIVGLLAYVLSPKKGKWIVLLVFSLGLIFVLSSYWLICLLLATFIVYVCGLLINKNNSNFESLKEGLSKEEKKELKSKVKKKNKALMITGVLLSITLLALLKYFNLPVGKLNDFFQKYSLIKISYVKIAFPILGISYYTLQAIGYLIDVGRGKYEATKNYFRLLLFMSFFPLQIEGPICRYDKIKDELYKESNPHYPDLCEGGVLILWGLFKKILIADRLNIIVSEVFTNYQSYNGIVIVFGAVCYAFQLYTDFSGYVDIARGASRLFGIKLPDNFDRPFMSKSVSEFWRRWHMSLGAWLRDYVFYSVALSKPYMSMNKKMHSHVKPFIEKLFASAVPLLFVWICCGIWHGSGYKYIVYGMYYYLIMVISMLLEPLHTLILNKLHLSREQIGIKFLCIIRTFVLVCFGLMMFRADTLSDYFKMISQIFETNKISRLPDFIITNKDLVVALISILFIVSIEVISEFKNLKEVFNKLPMLVRYGLEVSLLACVLIFGAYGSHYQPVDPMYAIY